MGFGDFVKSAAGGNIIGSAIGAVGSLIGGGMKNDAASALATAQYEHQKEFAQNGIRWKVADAKVAGIHPLAALGAQTFSYNPVMTTPGDNGIGEALGRMGQGISRAAEAKQLADERAANDAIRDLQIEGLRLDNKRKELEVNAEYARQAYDLADRIVAKQQQVPPMPEANANERSVSPDLAPLLNAARVGNAVILHINPDISDSITEDALKNLAVNIAAEAKAGRIKPEVLKFFSPREREALKRGDADIVYSPPLTFNFLWKPHMREKYSSDRREVSGRIKF